MAHRQTTDFANGPPGESDLWIPKPPEGEIWDGHTIHTHYFGFSIHEHAIGAFIYVRYQPVFNLCSSGISIFQGMDNNSILDIEHNNFIITMPWPEAVDNVIETNGLKLSFLEPGNKIRLEYKSQDGKTSFDVMQTAMCPLMPRGFVMPGEEVNTDVRIKPGGSEQSMHCVGILNLNDQEYKVDCYAARDRSWRQVRTEDEVVSPPFCWSPISFGPDLCFNQVGIEHPDTNPIWDGVFEVDKSKPSHHFGWVVVDGEPRNLVRVKRNVLEYHPTLFNAIRQELEAEDAKGQTFKFKGHAIAAAHLPSWPNNMFVDSVYEWEDDKGRKTYGTYQEAWYARNQRFRIGKIKANKENDS